MVAETTMSLLLGNSWVRPKAVLGRQETKRWENGEDMERASISEFPSGWGTHIVFARIHLSL